MTNPRLLAISGSFEGTTYALDGREMSIGRDKTNDLRIPDRSISRRHCLVKNDGAGFSVVDLGSFNGTFVNGEAARETAIRHGDRLTLGDISFIFFEFETETGAPGAVEFGSEITAGSTVRLEKKDAIYLNSAQMLTALAPDETTARSLSALLDLNVRLGRLRDLESLQKTVFDSLFEALPARRGAILLFDDDFRNPTAVFSRGRTAGANQPIRLSQTVAEQVAREKTAVLCRRVETNPAFKNADSLLAARTDSLLCVPLAAGGESAGLIYLDTDDPARGFDENHLQFAAAVAGIFSVVLENVRHLERLESENLRLRREIRLEHNMIGESAAMQKVFRFIEKVAAADTTVLIRGESGTGKELAAAAIHENSERSAKPFVAINCAALQDNLLESELFGHERGAFTTAVAQKKGKFEIADGGTIFLDEVGEMSLAMQVKLLRVLQEREFERVGGTRPIRVDVRVVAATNRALEDEIKNGNFRSDLYYRLNVVELRMPPLRERREDILPLAEHFVAKYGPKCKRKVDGISREARHLLTNYDFPGNVRELENAIERAVVLGGTEFVLPEDLPETMSEAAGAETPVLEYQKAVNEMKKSLILKTLAQAGGSYTEAARILGLHPANLHRLIRTLNVRKPL
ncbi:MAG: sigma 54-interacting transcriptional regulator [Acidobacteria bacterium]|nr:sigma 54-interacting transcriptional regulator [Acidobacteriota bacterium]